VLNARGFSLACVLFLQVLKPTNPIAQKTAIESPVYRVSAGSASKIKPKVKLNNHIGSPATPGKTHQLFAGLDQEDEAAVSNKSFVAR